MLYAAITLRSVPSENGEAHGKIDLDFQRREQNCVEKILLTAQTLLYHTYTITIF